MKVKFFIPVLVLLFTSPSFSCQLKQKESLIVGCSYRCDMFYRLRLKLSALALRYPIKIVDLRNSSYDLSTIDALLIPGGADIDPVYYQDQVTPELGEYIKKNSHLVHFSYEGKFRDQFEFDLVKNYSQKEEYQHLPLLGICRGMQMMTVAEKIPLYLDIKTELGIKNRKYVFDRINVTDENSTMVKLYGKNSFRGFEIHHQGLRVPYFNQHQEEFSRVKVSAYSNNGLIAEAIEYQHRPAIGVQFHPEKSLFRTSGPILHWFLKKACEYKNSKKERL
ncbi:MAG: gamma-glutamyl-gamma-aminobutyrate hydrolase family protein [Bacteriovoracaceae bacterium]